MRCETVKVYKGKSEAIINRTDLEEWNERGYVTSSQRQKAAKNKKNVKSGKDFQADNNEII